MFIKHTEYIADVPRLMREWNFEKNGTLDPSTITVGSGAKVWWRCSKGHEWQALVYDRYNGKGCPYCAGKKVLEGYNDLQTIDPDLSKEWNYEKNGELKPSDFTISSGRKVWWKCSNGHEWQAVIRDRRRGRGCPFCSGRYSVKGVNDLQTMNPSLAKEWNFDKNGNLLPSDVAQKSGKKVWWRCDKGHEWQATIANRSKGMGCPVCSSEHRTSFPEYAILYYLRRCGFEVVHSYKDMGYELDIYLPAQKVAIEYDGYHWHKDKTESDLEKNEKCEKDGIKLYRIREKLPMLNHKSVDYIIQNQRKDLSKTLEKLFYENFRISINIDVDRDMVEIENLREYVEKESSILYTNPNLLSEWNYERNGSLKPEHYKANSNKKVWWKCENGHEWQATISSRNSGVECPYCRGQKVLVGYNDLQTHNPKLANEWN